MLTQCEWTSASAIPSSEQERSSLVEAEQLIRQLTHLFLRQETRRYRAGTTSRAPELQIEGQACVLPEGDRGQQHPLLQETEELVDRCARHIAASSAATAREQRIAREYRAGIDALRKRRLREMGGEVQREHEACLANILELQWHVSHTERKLESLRDQVRKKKRQHALLKESEDHMTEHSPLAREKGEAELSLTSVIQSELASTEGEIETRDSVRGKQRDVWKREQIQTERARAEMAAEKSKLERELKIAREELAEAEETERVITKETQENTSRKENNEKECSELSQREQGCISSTENIMKSIGNMETHLKDLKQQVGVYKEKSGDAEIELQTEVEAVEREERQLKDEVRKCNTQLHEARDEHETLIQDIDSLKETRERCKKEMKDNSNTITRIQKQMLTLEQQVSVAEEEANKMREIHQDIALKVRELENTVKQEESDIKKTMARVDKSLKEETHTLTVTQVKVQVEEKGLEKLGEQFQSKKETMTRVLTETEGSRDGQKTTIEELQFKSEQLSQGISETSNQLTELQEKRNKHIQETTNNKSLLLPQRDGLALKVSETKIAIEKFASDQLSSSSKLDDVTSSRCMMESMTDQLLEETAEMREQQEEIQVVVEGEREERAALETEKEQLKLFGRNVREKHSTFVLDKQEEISKSEELLSEAVRENAQLTEQYRHQQSSHMSARTSLLQWTDEKLKLTSGIKDHKQLMGIQSRMHTAAQEYYRQRGNRSQQQLVRLVQQGEDNTERAMGMKSLLENVMSEIKSFLEVYGKMSAVRGARKSRVTFSDVIEFDTDANVANRSTLPPIHNTNNNNNNNNY